MAASRYPQNLVRSSCLLAAGGILILGSAVIFLAAALYHLSLLTGYGPTFVIIAPVPAVAFSVASLAVQAGSLFVWFRSRSTGAVLAGRISLAAIIVVLAAWLAVGAAFIAPSVRGGAA